jgi:hypothetical protein
LVKPTAPAMPIIVAALPMVMPVPGLRAMPAHHRAGSGRVAADHERGVVHRVAARQRPSFHGQEVAVAHGRRLDLGLARVGSDANPHAGEHGMTGTSQVWDCQTIQW